MRCPRSYEQRLRERGRSADAAYMERIEALHPVVEAASERYHQTREEWVSKTNDAEQEVLRLRQALGKA